MNALDYAEDYLHSKLVIYVKFLDELSFYSAPEPVLGEGRHEEVKEADLKFAGLNLEEVKSEEGDDAPDERVNGFSEAENANLDLLLSQLGNV